MICVMEGVYRGQFSMLIFLFRGCTLINNTVTMDITGHSTREMFDRYNTVDEKEKLEAIDGMDAMINSEKVKS